MGKLCRKNPNKRRQWEGYSGTGVYSTGDIRVRIRNHSFVRFWEHRKERDECRYSAGFLLPDYGCHMTSHSQHHTFLPWWAEFPLKQEPKQTSPPNSFLVSCLVPAPRYVKLTQAGQQNPWVDRLQRRRILNQWPRHVRASHAGDEVRQLCTRMRMVQPGHRLQWWGWSSLGTEYSAVSWEMYWTGKKSLCPRLSVNLDKLLTPRPPDLSLWKKKVVSIPCCPSSSTYLSAPRDTNNHRIPPLYMLCGYRL